jgi:hypothetical protein
MESLCHRCGNALQQDEVFCPHCGAPQFVVEAAEPGAAAQQPAMRFQNDAQRVQWRVAITSALILAVPVGLLSGLVGTYLVIVLIAGFAAVSLYQRRAASLTNGSVGWRVGSILGAASALLASGAYAVRMLVERYLMHGGHAIDQEFQSAATQMAGYWIKASAQQGPQPEDVVHAIKTLTAFFLSPDGHAALQLMTTAVMSVGMLLFAAAGGAIGGWLQTTRARTQRSL